MSDFNYDIKVYDFSEGFKSWHQAYWKLQEDFYMESDKNIYINQKNAYVAGFEFADFLQRSKIKEAEARLKEAESVIDFYTDKDSWGFNVSIEENIIIHPSDHELYFLGGKRARAYQQKYKDKE